MRHVQITHIYVLPIPDEEDVAVLDPIINSGVSMMEEFMKARAVQIQDLHSDWQMMPKEYSAAYAGPEEERIPGRVPKRYDQDPNMTQAEKDLDSRNSKFLIENDLDAGISFTGDVLGQRGARALHPWEQGLSIFPEDHPLRPFEDRLRQENEAEALEAMQALAPKLKELPPGEEQDE